MKFVGALLGAIVLSVTLIAPAHAAKRNWKAEKAAKAASKAVEAHCVAAEGQGEEAAAAATALKNAREAVSASLEAHGQLDLMYWRGVISQCLEDDGTALQDLNLFLISRGDATRWKELADDAERRVSDLETYEEPPQETRSVASFDPRIVSVAGLGGSSLVFGLLSGAAWGAAEQQAQILYTGAHVGSDIQPILDAGDQAAGGSRALGVTSLLTGAGAGALALLFFKPWQGTGGVAVVPLVVPHDQGAAFTLTGTW